MKSKAFRATVLAALLIQACSTEETGDRLGKTQPSGMDLPLTWPCLGCIAAIGGGQCADELNACEADDGCWQMFASLRMCEALNGWTREQADACGIGATEATTPGSKDLACNLYSCTWGRGNPPQEWLNCLQGGVDGTTNGCNEDDNAIMSHVLDACSW